MKEQNADRSGKPGRQGSRAEYRPGRLRLLDLLDTPRDIPFLAGRMQREIVYSLLRSSLGKRLRAIATLGEQSNRTAKAVV